MAKTLVAHEWPLTKIFSDDYVFRIPAYQRPYAWTTEQAQELLDDLLGAMQPGGPIEELSPYFLGSIVLIKQEGIPQADVVDGQQRLTTLTLLLTAIRANANGLNAAEITPLIYERGSAIRGTTDHFRLTLRDRDSEFFREFVQREGGFEKLIALSDELTDSRKRLRTNAQYFADRVKALSETERLRLAQFIVTRCYLVVVSTADLESAYRIFSVLNSRGLDLAPTDILKSEIIGAISAGHRDAYTAKWEGAEEDLGREGFTDLFAHIRMIYRRAKPKGTLIKEFKEHVTEASQPMLFMDSVLLPMAKSYGELVSAAYESTSHTEEVNEHLKWLNRLEFTDWVPPALSFSVQHRQKPAEMAAFFQDLERLGYALLILGAGINERIERFSRLTTEIIENRDLHAVDSALQLSAPEQGRILLRLDGAFYEMFYARARTTILLRIDTLLSEGGANYDYKTVSVEHVLPQTPEADSTWLQWFPDEDERRLWVHRLGNLALLTRRKNSAASNYEFDKKKVLYFGKGGVSPFVLTTQVLEKSEWTPAVVAERQATMLARLTKHWRLMAPTAPVG